MVVLVNVSSAESVLRRLTTTRATVFLGGERVGDGEEVDAGFQWRDVIGIPMMDLDSQRVFLTRIKANGSDRSSDMFKLGADTGTPEERGHLLLLISVRSPSEWHAGTRIDGVFAFCSCFLSHTV